MILKPLLLYLMGLIIAGLLIRTIFFVGNQKVGEIIKESNCTGKLQMTCGEGGCIDICYPLPIANQ